MRLAKPKDLLIVLRNTIVLNYIRRVFIHIAAPILKRFSKKDPEHSEA